MRLDAHQHFWQFDALQYPWIAEGSPLHRDWLPKDLEPLLATASIDGCIAVQARQSIEESRWLLALAKSFPFIKGVVGWVDLRSPVVGDQLAELAADPRFRGVRHVLQDESDDRFMLAPEFLRGIANLHEFGLTYDLLIFPRQLGAALELVRKFPEQRFVVDHIAKPDIKTQTLSPWREQIRELSREPNVFCKISGMVTEANLATWQPADLKPFLDVVTEAFTDERLMFGSDWPVCLRAATYPRVLAAAQAYFATSPEPAQQKIFGGNCARFYSLP